MFSSLLHLDEKRFQSTFLCLYLLAQFHFLADDIGGYSPPVVGILGGLVLCPQGLKLWPPSVASLVLGLLVALKEP